MRFKFNPMTGNMDVVEKKLKDFSFCQYRNTDTTTNINTSTATAIPFSGLTDRSSEDFSLSGSTITCNFSGFINVQAHISQFSISSQRTSVSIYIKKNDSQVSGLGIGGYIRRSSNHDESSAHISSTFLVEDGDEIQIMGKQEAASGSVTQILNASQVTIERRS